MDQTPQKPGAIATVSLLVSLLTGIVLFYNQSQLLFKSSEDTNLRQRVEQLESKSRLDRIEIEKLRQRTAISDKQR